MTSHQVLHHPQLFPSSFPLSVLLNVSCPFVGRNFSLHGSDLMRTSFYNLVYTNGSNRHISSKRAQLVLYVRSAFGCRCMTQLSKTAACEFFLFHLENGFFFFVQHAAISVTQSNTSIVVVGPSRALTRTRTIKSKAASFATLTAPVSDSRTCS